MESVKCSLYNLTCRLGIMQPGMEMLKTANDVRNSPSLSSQAPPSPLFSLNAAAIDVDVLDVALLVTASGLRE